MFRFVTDGARSVGTFVAKVLSPRAAEVPGHSELDTALSSSSAQDRTRRGGVKLDDRLEEAGAESPLRSSRQQGGGRTKAKSSPGRRAKSQSSTGLGLAAGLQPDVNPGSPRLTPPTPDGSKRRGGLLGNKGGVQFSDATVASPKASTRSGARVRQATLKQAALIEGSLKRTKRGFEGENGPIAKKGRVGNQLGGLQVDGTPEDVLEGREKGVKIRTMASLVGNPGSDVNALQETLSGGVQNAPASTLPVRKRGGVMTTRTTVAATTVAATVGIGRFAEPEPVKTPRRTKPETDPTGGVNPNPVSKPRGNKTAAGKGKGAEVARGEGADAEPIPTPPGRAGRKRKAEGGSEMPGGKGEGQAVKTGGKGIIGKRIKVLWEKGVVPGVKNDTWYEGMVTGYNPKSKFHGITYDDGDFEEEDLSATSATKFEFLG